MTLRLVMAGVHPAYAREVARAVARKLARAKLRRVKR